MANASIKNNSDIANTNPKMNLNHMKKLFFANLFFLCFIYTAIAQNIDSLDYRQPPTSFEEVLRDGKNDTIIFFYNHHWGLAKPTCATIFRKSLIDEELMTYKGGFTDYYMLDSTIALEGNYSGGKKEGRFNWYYPNGQLRATGDYKNNMKSGIWKYYYENGLQQQVLEFSGHEIIIKEFWDETGKKMVDNGNGDWHKYSEQHFTKIAGPVLNGRKNGTWRRTIPSENIILNVERYKEGKMISGRLTPLRGGSENYKDTSYCLIEETPDYLIAEEFKLSICYSQNNFSYATYPGGMLRFYQQIRNKIQLTAPFLQNTKVEIQITIDDSGNMKNFNPITNTGHEMALIAVLQTMDKWYPAKRNGVEISQNKIISIRF